MPAAVALRSSPPGEEAVARSNIIDVVQVDAARVGFFAPEDLDRLSRALDAAIADLIIERSPLVASEKRAATRARLAIALLDLAESGERDEERLKRLARAALDDRAADASRHRSRAS
jgi:hypothetical protein